MTGPAGFFHLQTPVDLLTKMEFHFGQLTENPLDEYAAFDFFVAAAHLPEWLGKFQCSSGKGDARAQALHAVCSHLANGAKHFTTDASHTAVRGQSIATPAYAGIARAGITLSGGLTKKRLVLLAPDEAIALGVEVISTIALAQMVLTHWKEHEALKRAAAKASGGELQ